MSVPSGPDGPAGDGCGACSCAPKELPLPTVALPPGVATAGHSVPPAAGRGWPELPEESAREEPLPAVEGAAKGSIAKSRKATTIIRTTTETIQDTLFQSGFQVDTADKTCFSIYYKSFGTL